jgi:hypothetical protein
MTQPPYGRYPPYWPGPYGQPPPQPPPQKKLLPWLIVGVAVLLSGLGLLLVVLLRGGDSDTTNAGPTSAAPASSAPTGSASASAHAGMPDGAQVADQDTGGQARFDGSDRVALVWVQAMADGDFQTAYDLSCADVQRSATDAAAGADPARTLGSYFFDQTLSGRRFTAGSFDSIIYNQQSDSDIASFTLQLDDSEEFLLLVYVQSDGTVCDFI